MNQEDKSEQMMDVIGRWWQWWKRTSLPRDASAERGDATV